MMKKTLRDAWVKKEVVAFGMMELVIKGRYKRF